ncbi:MAG: bacteriohemerythrin [Rhodospirillales bacterium]|nr:bacteriohemerythrin [Rhodospirillales bacterium]
MTKSKQSGAALMRQSKAELADQVMTLTRRLEELEAVTERKDNRLEQQLRQAIEMLPHPVIIYDLDDYLVFFNQAYHDFFPYMPPLEEVAGKYFLDFIQYSIDMPGVVVDPLLQEDLQAYQAKRLDRLHNPPQGSFEQFTSGCWQLVSEHRIEGLGFFSIRQDITDKVMAEQALAAAKDEAESASKAKSEFLASMSHEFRTPMNAILGFAQMLQYNPKEPLTDTQGSNIDNIIQGGQHLLELINEILDLAQVESDHFRLNLKDVTANKLVANCLSLTTSLAESRGITIVDHFSDAPEVLLYTDPLRFKQILINLLSNAVKYNRKGGMVSVEGQVTDDDFLRLSVTDSGIGISKEDSPNIFLRFQRIKSDRTKPREGTGIGLTVSNILVNRMAGRIGFDSEVGVGSTFWVELPLCKNKNVLIWTDTLQVGVVPIDQDHQEIISLLNRLTLGASYEVDLDAVIEEMIDYTQYHFQREEAIMEACNYPDLESHRDFHRKLIIKVNELASAWRKNNNPETFHKLREFLRGWWIGHIINVDKKISEYAKGKERDIAQALKNYERQKGEG